MFNVLRTLFAGASARAEEQLVDTFAIDLIEQKIREADAGLAAAKNTLAALIVRQRNEQQTFDRLVAQITDLEARVRQALASGREDLATDGASDAQFPVFFVLRDETGVIGCVALEVFGDDAVLRALAVASSRRGGGYGWMLADLAVSQARYRGVRRMYLVTESASDFFAAKFGFRAVDRSTISAKVAGSQAFKADGSTSAVAMRLDL